MEQNFKKPADFAEMNNEEMTNTEGGTVIVRVSHNGMMAARNMTAAAFGNYICQCLGISKTSNAGVLIYAQACAKRNTAANGGSFSILTSLSRTIYI